MSYQGTISRGIRTPIIRKGDDLVNIVADSVLAAAEEGHFEIQDKDVIAVTEAVVARCDGNYATVDQIAFDINEKFDSDTLGLVFPILSRNRFSMVLKGIAKSGKKLVIQLAYPSDEVGNSFITYEQMLEQGINPYSDSFTSEEFKKIFGENLPHHFTGVDYIDYYKDFTGGAKIILSNNPCEILKYAKDVIACDIHTRKRTKKLLLNSGANNVITLDEILNKSNNNSGYNPQYGVLGSNLATEDTIKLFPKNAKEFVLSLQAEMKKRTGKNVECMVYGDGAFKDPVGGIWELADPVCSPGFTDGLMGTPNEVKFKYIADNKLGHLTGKEAEEAMKEIIRQKDKDLKGNILSQGTTPRQLTDLLGSLSDLTSGSGDKGTPVVLIQNYFKNYSN